MTHSRDMYGRRCGGQLIPHGNDGLYRCTSCGQIGHHGTRPLTAVPGTGQTQEVTR